MAVSKIVFFLSIFISILITSLINLFSILLIVFSQFNLKSNAFIFSSKLISSNKLPFNLLFSLFFIVVIIRSHGNINL